MGLIFVTIEKQILIFPHTCKRHMAKIFMWSQVLIPPSLLEPRRSSSQNICESNFSQK